MVEGDVAVVGGGFFGAYLALKLAKTGRKVILLEAGPALMQRASLVNQARVHHGYHYPRSTLTALRSRENYGKFLEDFSYALDTKVEAYYAVATQHSKINADQFYRFMQRIGAPIRPAPRAIGKLFDPTLIEATFQVEEAVFDSAALRARMEKDLEAAGVKVLLNTKVERLNPGGVIETRNGKVQAKQTLVCTYGFTNEVLVKSGLTPLDLRNELAEMALVQPPAELQGKAFTVMCGPFFSLLPYPTANCYTLSHVRFTPHETWTGITSLADDHCRVPPPSRSSGMMKDAMRYLPCVGKSSYLRSIYEIKTLLPKSEHNDSRPILVKSIPERPDVLVVIGGKIDNVYDAWDTLSKQLTP